METKTFELRDSATFIPVLATRLNPACEADRFLFGRAGYSPHAVVQSSYILLCRFDGGVGQCSCDPYDWSGSRTMTIAHQYMTQNWNKLTSGQVLDVEFIIGITSAPKESESVK